MSYPIKYDFMIFAQKMFEMFERGMTFVHYYTYAFTASLCIQ